MITGWSSLQLIHNCNNVITILTVAQYLPVLSVICTTAVDWFLIIWELLLASENVKLKYSFSSTNSSQLSDKLKYPTISPALIVMLNGSEWKSTDDPVRIL